MAGAEVGIVRFNSAVVGSAEDDTATDQIFTFLSLPPVAKMLAAEVPAHEHESIILEWPLGFEVASS